MRQAYFGPLTTVLSEQDLARLLVIASEAVNELELLLRGITSPSTLQTRLEQIGHERSRQDRIHLHSPLDMDIHSLRELFAAHMPDDHGAMLIREALPRLWAALTRHFFPPYLITVRQLSADDTHLDRRWLVEMLTAEEHVLAATIETHEPQAGRWSWPLQIGLPSSPSGRALHEALQDAAYRGLYTPLLLGEDTDHVDLLLIPDSLQAADRLHHWTTVKADSVLILGSTRKRRDGRASRVLGSMMSRYSAGMAGLCFVPSDEQVPWVQTLIRELSHNQSLPSAAFIAKARDQRTWEGGRKRALRAPLLLGDPDFVRSTPISAAALRMARVLQDDPVADSPVQIDAGFLPMSSDDSPHPATAREIGRLLETSVESFQWLRESGDATSFVKLRQDIEAQIGSIGLEHSLPPPEDASSPHDASDDRTYSWIDPGILESAGSVFDLGDESGMEPEEESEEAGEPEDRFVQAKITPLSPAGACNVTHLTADTDYRMRVHIGAHKDDRAIMSNVRLDETALPPSRTGHDLKLVYCPLSPVVDDSGESLILPPVQETIHLPNRGDSGHADFTLRCGSEPDAFRARLIVAHQNRVLQTLLVRTEGERAKVVIQDENRFVDSQRFAYPGEPADIAFLVNDNPAGISGVTTLTGGSASFVEPPGLKMGIETICKLLTKRNIQAVGTRKPKLNSASIRKLLINLAQHGAELADELQYQHPNVDFAEAHRIQVAEARDKAYLPVEFFYAGIAPRPTAQLCPDAIAVLTDANRHARCQHHGDEYICPSAFWGLHKCIERFPSNEGGTHKFTAPQPGLDRLGPFLSALLAASDRASEQMTGPNGVPDAVAKFVPNVGQAKSWSEWATLVAGSNPQLMLLLPHSANSPALVDVPALEVSGDWLESSRVNTQHVRTGVPGPLVLLLGCSTLLTDIEYMNFVHKFFRKGAPVVVGTLAIIHATQASLVACTLMQEINAGTGTARFDETLLDAKRQLLAQGYEVALGLIAYGHSSWRL